MKMCVYTKSSYFTVFRNNAAEIEIVPKSHLYQEKKKGEEDENKDTIKQNTQKTKINEI